MALVRYEPWSLISRLQNDINRALGDVSSGDSSGASTDWVPAADIDEYVDRFELSVDLPGVVADDVEITLDKGVLSVSGERRVEERTEQLSQSRRERGRGRFYRRFVLPDTVNAEGVEAHGRDGVLVIAIPKQAAAQPRRIKVAA
jgi:HSP20 family protein